LARRAIFALPLAFAKIIDIRGAFGVPGTGESMPGVFWGALVVSLVCGFFFFRSLIRPRVVRGSWTSMIKADVGDYTVMAGNRAWKVNYDYLTSHPSYSLLLLLTAPIPAVMVLMTINHGDSTLYWRVAGIVGLVILALMAVARVLAWYVFRFGRRQLDTQAEAKGMSPRKLGWEIAWKPVLMLMVMVYSIVKIYTGTQLPLGCKLIGCFQDGLVLVGIQVPVLAVVPRLCMEHRRRGMRSGIRERSPRL
jgi:hypothetical protein